MPCQRPSRQAVERRLGISAFLLALAALSRLPELRRELPTSGAVLRLWTNRGKQFLGLVTNSKRQILQLARRFMSTSRDFNYRVSKNRDAGVKLRRDRDDLRHCAIFRNPMCHHFTTGGCLPRILGARQAGFDWLRKPKLVFGPSENRPKRDAQVPVRERRTSSRTS